MLLYQWDMVGKHLNAFYVTLLQLFSVLDVLSSISPDVLLSVY